MSIDELLAEESTRGQFSGTVLVRQAGATLLNHGYGYADREQQKPHQPETIFQIASISKQFGAAAVLLLQEQGLLSVHDPINRWVPHCPAAWEAITVHQLITHTSGIGHWHDFPDLSLFEPREREELIRIFQGIPLIFSPGTQWEYSSPGYVLLAHIVERVTGEPYSRVLAERIFEPLGIHHTGAGNVSPDRELQALGYSGDEPAPSFELDTVGIGAGDIWSTTEELASWDSALAENRLLAKESLQTMFAPHAASDQGPPDLSDEQYGYGWVSARFEGRKLIYHTGGNSGFVSINAWLPDDDALVIILSNDDATKPMNIAKRLIREVLDREMV